MGCVYLVTNTETLYQYVGFTSKTMEFRRKAHHSYAKRGIRGHFYSALLKYGEDVFHWRILFESDDISLLKKMEIHYIKEYSPAYNMTKGGDGVTGFPLSEEHRRKISNSQIDNPKCEEGHRKQADALRGRKFSDEHRNNLAESQKGKHSGKHKGGWKVSEDRKHKISESLKKHNELKKSGEIK